MANYKGKDGDQKLNKKVGSPTSGQAQRGTTGQNQINPGNQNGKTGRDGKIGNYQADNQQDSELDEDDLQSTNMENSDQDHTLNQSTQKKDKELNRKAG